MIYMTTRIEAVGAINAMAEVGKAIGVKPTTVYGWWRRGNIPGWRLPAFASLISKPSKRKAA